MSKTDKTVKVFKGYPPGPDFQGEQLMPGPVSDSYDPEFGTAERADSVRAGIEGVRAKITAELGTTEFVNIVDVCDWARTKHLPIKLDKRELRIIRFCLNRALESI